ncbi:hypothetical protein PMAYCL1PPCAC_06816, partial [Pristionchus mayeri]
FAILSHPTEGGMNGHSASFHRSFLPPLLSSLSTSNRFSYHSFSISRVRHLSMDLEKLLSNETVSVKADEEEDSKELLKPTPISNLTLASSLYESLISLYANPALLTQLNSAILSQSLLNPLLFPLETNDDETSETPKPVETRSKSSETMVDQMIPNTDKEGWCRNKKFILKTDTGFMCTLCKK